MANKAWATVGNRIFYSKAHLCEEFERILKEFQAVEENYKNYQDQISDLRAQVQTLQRQNKQLSSEMFKEKVSAKVFCSALLKIYFLFSLFVNKCLLKTCNK